MTLFSRAATGDPHTIGRDPLRARGIYRARNSTCQKEWKGEKCRTFTSNPPKQRDSIGEDPCEIRGARDGWGSPIDVRITREGKSRGNETVRKNFGVTRSYLTICIRMRVFATYVYFMTVNIDSSSSSPSPPSSSSSLSPFYTPKATVQTRNAKDFYSIIIPICSFMPSTRLLPRKHTHRSSV